MGEAAKRMGLPEKEGTITGGLAGRQYSPGKGVAIASGIAGVSSALSDDDEEAGGTTTVGGTTPAGGQQQNQQQNQQQYRS